MSAIPAPAGPPPTDDLKTLFRDAAKRMHPDLVARRRRPRARRGVHEAPQPGLQDGRRGGDRQPRPPVGDLPLRDRPAGRRRRRAGAAGRRRPRRAAPRRGARLRPRPADGTVLRRRAWPAATCWSSCARTPRLALQQRYERSSRHWTRRRSRAPRGPITRDGANHASPRIDRRARTWMSWLLLAVFVALACLSAGLWRAQVQRQNDQAFAAQAASVGASVTTAVRRMDDLTLAARTLVANEPRPDQRGVRALVRVDGRRQALQGRRGLRVHGDRPQAGRRRLPARQARVLLPAADRRRRARA